MNDVTIRSPSGETTAEFVPAANLVCRSLRHRGAEHLDPGHGVEAYAEHGKTMGIPLLYPWANRLDGPGYTVAGRTVRLPGEPGVDYPVDPNGLPIHGALPGRLAWETTTVADRELTARLAWDSEERLALFPFRHHVEVTARVDDGSLTLTTTVLADGGDQVPVSFGYHPYLTLPGVSRTRWAVQLGATEHLTLDARMLPTGARAPVTERSLTLGERSFDDGYASLTDPARFVAAADDRRIAVTFGEGYAWAQVYAPPGHDFICFEPMTAPTDALGSGTALTVLAPGERYRASFTVDVSG